MQNTVSDDNAADDNEMTTTVLLVMKTMLRQCGRKLTNIKPEILKRHF